MDSTAGTKLVLLGTGGGPLPSPVRSGIAQAVVVEGHAYLVDCGSGVTRQLRRARLLSSLHQVYLTHLHSDHDCDYFNLFLLGWPILMGNPPVHVYGPGRAGWLPPVPPDRPADRPVPLVHPANPTPGLVDLTRSHVEAHAYDLNVRLRHTGRDDLTRLVVPHEIALPPDLVTGPDDVAPPMTPIVVMEDDRVRVTATLVAHAPVFPAFAFRLDTADGSVVISGDTAPCANLVTLAHGADILVHEVFTDQNWQEIAPDRVPSWEAQQRERHLFTAHTGLSAVGKIAAEAEVGRLVLTHFIPGDDARPDAHWREGVVGFDGEVIVGSDLLELRL